MWAPLRYLLSTTAGMPVTRRQGLILGLFSVNLLCSSTFYAQRQWTSFGRQAELPLDYFPVTIALTQVAGVQAERVVVSERETPLLHFYRVEKNGEAKEYRSLEFPSQVQSLRVVTAGGTSTYFGLSREGDSLAVVRETRSRIRRRLIPLPGVFERFVLSDLNNDGLPDLILFGRFSAGIALLMGGEGERFLDGPVLFPEVSASDVWPRDLNGDGITDLVLADWLSAQLILVFGVGRAIFGEQVSYPLPGEPTDLAIAEDTKNRTFTIAVSIPERDAILTVEGNALGELRESGRVDVSGGSSGLAYTSVNGDQLPDLAGPTKQGFMIALGVSPSSLGAPTFFGGSTIVSGWALGDVDGDRENDLVLIDSTSRRLVLLANANSSGGRMWPDVYAVGRGPCSVTAGDLNGDGESDIAVATRWSSAVSVLYNRGNGIFDGQQSLSLADPPTALTIVTAPLVETPVLVTSSGGVPRLGILSPERKLSASSVATISACDNPEVLAVTGVTGRIGLRLLVRCRDSRGGQMLSILDQLDGMNFLERTVQTGLPYSISALTVSRLQSSEAFDYHFAAHDSVSRSTTVYVAHSDDSLTFAPPERLFSFPDSSRGVSGIIVGDVETGVKPDILLPLGPPVNAMLVAPSSGRGGGRDSLYLIRGIHMSDGPSVVFQDVNGDGTRDLTYLDQAKGAVMILYGRAKGKFSAPATIWRGRAISSICIASLRRPDASDLILADAARSSITVVFNPFAK